LKKIKKNCCLCSREQCKWNRLTTLIFRRKKLFTWIVESCIHCSLNSRARFNILTHRKQLLAAFLFLAFQTQQTVGPMNSNKRLLINQTACKMKPQETWTLPRNQMGSKKSTNWYIRDRMTSSKLLITSLTTTWTKFLATIKEKKFIQ
jgi:hypothetical protein